MVFLSAGTFSVWRQCAEVPGEDGYQTMEGWRSVSPVVLSILRTFPHRYAPISCLGSVSWCLRSSMCISRARSSRQTRKTRKTRYAVLCAVSFAAGAAVAQQPASRSGGLGEVYVPAEPLGRSAPLAVHEARFVRTVTDLPIKVALLS